MNLKDLLDDCKEKFEQVLLLIESSENDPETEPFRSRYEANKLLSELKLRLTGATAAEKVSDEDAESECVAAIGDINLTEEGSEDESAARVNVALALVQYYLSLNYFETEEFSQAMESIDESLATVEKISEEQLKTSLHICCLNQKAVLKSRTESEHQYEEARDCLKLACGLFKSWSREKGLDQPPSSFDHVLRPQSGPESVEKLTQSFESLHTTSLYLLAQVWKHMGLKTNSTLACYLTLKRILSGQGDVEKVDWVDWSLNCATLSQCFVTDELYSEARECLHAAYCAFEKLQISLQEEDNSKPEGQDADKESSKEKVEHCKADIDRCCVKYAINLLNSSWTFKSIPEQEMRQTYEEAARDIQDATFCSFDLNHRLVDLVKPCFPNVRVNFQVTCSQVSTFEEAREVFLFGQAKCNQAKLFFTENQWCRDYLDLIRDHSQLFKNLANFESDLQRKISMNKKRTDLLISALTNLSPEHYLQICRQLQFELGETFSDISDLQKDLFASKKDVSVASAKKLNSSINKSINYFNEFLKTFEDKSGKMPEQFPEMYVRPGLMAKFYMARLLSKLIAPPNVKAENVEKSGSYYKFIADYCDRFEGAFDQMKSEYPICKEMSLLTNAKKNASLSGAKI